MKKLLLSSIICLFAFVLRAETISYTLRMDQPQHHYFDVEITVGQNTAKTLDFKMPVWAPGSYLVREFSKNVDFFEANSGDKKLNWKKTDKNTWSVDCAGSKEIKVRYKVYAFELTVRTSFLDVSHGFVSGTSVFMYVDQKQQLPGTLTIIPYKDFRKISTGLEQKETDASQSKSTGYAFSFPNYDILADSPIEIGNQDVFYFEASGVRHQVCMYGEGNYQVEKLQKDMAKIVDAATAVYGENPNKNYVFIIHNVTVSSGGLEHLNSTTLEVNRWSYTGGAYYGFLSLVAHEYFHLWNVKRARPNTLGPFDYDQENYTTLLWVMEGFTSYYDELLLKRTGYYDQKDYLRSLSSSINSVENTPGTKVQSMAESSFDAWIKGYRTNENSNNTQISYYTKGQLLGALLDMEIIALTNGEKKLDDLMRYVYVEYYKKQNRGFTEAEFKLAAEKVSGAKLDYFFNEYVYKTTPIDYNHFLQPLGLVLKGNDRSLEPWFGARLSDSGGKLLVKEVTAGSSAWEHGLNVNDEIIALNGYRVDNTAFSKALGNAKIGDQFRLMISRDNVMMTLEIKLLPNSTKDHQVTVADQTDVKQEKLLKKWLD